MQLSCSVLALVAVFSTCTALALPAPAPQATPAAGAACFDAGDCILSGGGMCNKATGQLLGTCAPSAAGAGAAPKPMLGIPGLAPPASPASTPRAATATRSAGGAAPKASMAGAGAGAGGAPKMPPSPSPTGTGAVCFDAGDCILSGGGQCNKAAGQLTGQCSK